MANTSHNLTRAELERVNLAELSAEERAAVHVLTNDRCVLLGWQLAAALGMTPARAAELCESIRAKSMSNKQRRRRAHGGGDPSRHRRRLRMRREASR